MELGTSGSHNFAGNLPVLDSELKSLHYGTQRFCSRYRAIIIIWVMTPYSLVGRYWLFGGTSLHLQGGSDSLDICSADYVYNCLPIEFAIFGM
jgi:hypothetical protein